MASSSSTSKPTDDAHLTPPTTPTTTENIVPDSNFLHASVGSAASVFSMAICYPLDVLKTVLQLEDKSSSASQRIKEIIDQHGIQGFYSGMLPVLQTVAYSQFLYFYCFEAVKKLLAILKSEKEKNGASSPLASFIGSLIAGVINMVITEPLWKANIHCQVRIKQQKAEEERKKRERSQRERSPNNSPKKNDSSTSETNSSLNSNNVLSVAFALAKRDGVDNMWNGLSTSI